MKVGIVQAWIHSKMRRSANTLLTAMEDARDGQHSYVLR